MGAIGRGDEGVARDATTLGEVVDAYARDGFTGSFRTVPDARVRCLACRSMLEAATLRPISMRRLEGASDPADMLAVAALVCPVCAARGTLVLGYGPDAAAEDSDVLPALLAAPPPRPDVRVGRPDWENAPAGIRPLVGKTTHGGDR